MPSLAYIPLYLVGVSTGAPAEAPSLALSSKTTTTITITHTLPGDTTNYSRSRIYYGVPGAVPSNVTSNATENVTLTGLTPGQSYVIYAVAESGSGEQTASSEALCVATSFVIASGLSRRISMAYDVEARGFYLFLTPASGLGQHWWIDADTRAMWPVTLYSDHQPKSAACYGPSAVGDVVIGSQDGYVRYFSDEVTNDDGQDLESHVLLGPIRLASGDARDAVLAELHGLLDIESGGSVTWRVVLGDTAQEAAETAKTGVEAVQAGNSPSGVAASGTWGDGRNLVARPRSRGVWVVVWLSSTDQWAFEAVPIVARMLGRVR